MKMETYRVCDFIKKKRFRHRCYFCEFCEISHETFFKEPFGQLPLHKTRSVCLTPSKTLYLFKNDVSHIFRLSVFWA